jgi:hypothetical protein
MEVTSSTGGNNDASGSGQGGGEIPIKTKEQLFTASSNMQNATMQNVGSIIIDVRKTIQELRSKHSVLKNDENELTRLLENLTCFNIHAEHVMDITRTPGGGGGGEVPQLGAGDVAPPGGQEQGSG